MKKYLLFFVCVFALSKNVMASENMIHSQAGAEEISSRIGLVGALGGAAYGAGTNLFGQLSGSNKFSWGSFGVAVGSGAFMGAIPGAGAAYHMWQLNGKMTSGLVQYGLSHYAGKKR